MKIALVKPDNISDHIQPSIGLGILTNLLRNNGHKVYLLDFLKLKFNRRKLKEFIDIEQPDIIGFQCYTFDIFKVKDYAEFIKQNFSNIKIILGGPHPTTLPEETLDFFENLIDYIFLSEAENSLIDFCNGKDITEIKGIGYIDRITKKKVYSYPNLEDDIDKFGMPAWDIIKPETYPPAQHGAVFEKFPIAPIMLTRGCPFHCTFCAGNIIMGRKIRKRSIANILNEIKYLYDNHGIREFHIIDDNCSCDRIFFKNFLKELKDLKLDISWATPNGIRMDSLDDEMLELMKSTGLYLISLGIESGNDRILKIMKKSNTVEKIRKYVDLINRHKIDIAAFFILGFPGETKSEIETTIKFSLELPIIRANYFTFLPFPGTEVYLELCKQGKLNKVDWQKFLFMNAAYTPDGMTRKELRYLQRLAFLKFYLRPHIFLKNLKAIKSFNHFRFLVIRFIHWFFY